MNLQLTKVEMEILGMIVSLSGEYPKQIDLDWLREQFYQRYRNHEETLHSREMLRQRLLSLGIKLVALRVGSISRISKRGRFQKGIYQIVIHAPYYLDEELMQISPAQVAAPVHSLAS